MAREEAKKLPESTPASEPQKLIKAEVRTKHQTNVGSGRSMPYYCAGHAFTSNPRVVEVTAEVLAVLEQNVHLSVKSGAGVRDLPSAEEVQSSQQTIDALRIENAQLKTTLADVRAKLNALENPVDESVHQGPRAPMGPPAGLPRLG